MLSPQLVIFDCDGVLVDSEVISNRVLARELSAQGLPTTLAQARGAYQGLLLSEVLSKAEALLGRSLPEDWPPRYVEARAEAFRRGCARCPARSSSCKRYVRRRSRCVSPRRGRSRKTELSLELTGLSPLFTHAARFSAEQVTRGKPDPDLFLHAARVMGAEPTRCVVVEDTPSGVRAAVAARMRALGYAADSDPQALADAGAEPFMALAEVPGLIGLG